MLLTKSEHSLKLVVSRFAFTELRDFSIKSLQTFLFFDYFNQLNVMLRQRQLFAVPARNVIC